MLPEIPPEEYAACLDGVVEELLREAGVHAPPVDAFAVARGLGVTVARDDRQQGRARFVRLQSHRGTAPRATILLRSDPRTERRHWAVAHEIGEHAAWRVFSALGADPKEVAPAARETVANHLAGRLLLPQRWFAEDGPAENWDLEALKGRYRTASHELIARRMLEFPSPIIISIFDQGRLFLRRSNLPGAVPPPSDEETRQQQAAHATGFSQSEASIRCWPIHEPGWKREILRREVVEVFC